MFYGPLDDGRGKFRQFVSGQVGQWDEPGRGAVGTGAGFSRLTFAEKIHQDIMIGNAAGGIVVDAVQNCGDAQDGHRQAGFFQEFPVQGLLHGLPQFHQAAGEAPGIPGRFLTPAHQEDRVAPENHRSYAHQGLVGIMAFHFLVSSEQ